MSEKSYLIEDVDPMELLGVNNQNLKLLQSQFPKLKIVSRGQELTILGDEQEINHFEHKLDQMIDHIRKFGKL
ncbi:MAG: phosphate starvation-inducible protein PhoH, partial [Bacteroidia bacterium]|nr:phosphate starvation-inducible protein PhoH [Bacteroidia bacterium]